jgi:hypothetical protein
MEKRNLSEIRTGSTVLVGCLLAGLIGVDPALGQEFFSCISPKARASVYGLGT